MIDFEVIQRKSDGKYAIRVLKGKRFFKPVYEWFQENHEYKAVHHFDAVREAVLIEPNEPEVAIWMEDREALVERFDRYYQLVRCIHLQQQIELTKKTIFELEQAYRRSKEEYVVNSEMSYLY